MQNFLILNVGYKFNIWLLTHPLKRYSSTSGWINQHIYRRRQICWLQICGPFISPIQLTPYIYRMQAQPQEMDNCICFSSDSPDKMENKDWQRTPSCVLNLEPPYRIPPRNQPYKYRILPEPFPLESCPRLNNSVSGKFTSQKREANLSAYRLEFSGRSMDSHIMEV